MREFRFSKAYEQDIKHLSQGRYRNAISKDLKFVISILAADKPLDKRYFDHKLQGDWVGYRECHIKPDLILIYAKPDDSTLALVRIGIHSELFS